MKKKNKRIKTGEERAILFNLYHNGLFHHRIVPNKKKKEKAKKINWKQIVADYLNIKNNNLVLKQSAIYIEI